MTSAAHPPTQRQDDPAGPALCLTVAAHASEVPAVRLAARGFAEHHRVARPVDVALAVSEACANVVLHAYAGRPAGPLHVTGDVTGELVRITVGDEGSGVAPRLDSPGMGLGLPIIARASDHLEIGERAPTGALVTMGFARAPVSAWEAYAQARDDVTAAVHSGVSLDTVEARIAHAPLSTEERDALWLAAWATVDPTPGGPRSQAPRRSS